MDPAELVGLVATAVVVIAGAVAGTLKVRAAKTKDEDEAPTIVRVDDSTGAEDTGRFLVAMRQAPAPMLEDMARSLREIAGQRPATRDDLRKEVGALKGEINGRLDTHSAAIGGLRQDILALPCMQEPPENCPAIPGGNGGPRQ